VPSVCRALTVFSPSNAIIVCASYVQDASCEECRRVCSVGYSAKSRLTNLECEVCGVISYLHPTAYEELLGVEPKKMTSRELSHKDLLHRPSEIPSERKPSSRLDLSNTDGPPMLFCFSCETVCFSVDDYINGLHRNHEVGNTSRQETVAALKQLLAGTPCSHNRDQRRSQKAD
jgi:hypothetical protein